MISPATLASKYGEKGLSQFDRLQDLILTEESGSGQFNVFPSEAGFGKSIFTNQIVADHIKQGGFKSFLIVKKFIEDVHACAEFMNQECGTDAAIGISSDNWKDCQGLIPKLDAYQVVIITHKRYLNLSTDEHLKIYFKAGRYTLIIDEQIQAPIVNFNKEKYNSFLVKLPKVDLQEKFLKVCKELNYKIERQSLIPGNNNKIVKCNPNIEDYNMVEQFESDIDTVSINYKDKQNIKDFIEGLKVLYDSSECYYSNGNISCLDHNVNLWSLSNNLILDANGEIDKRYEVSPFLNVRPQEKLRDYSGDILYHIPVSTSKSGISNRKYVFQELCKEIQNNKKEGDKTLVITHKQYENSLNTRLKELGIYGERLAVAHFGDILGKNNWLDYNQVWVVATPIYTMESYVLNYLFFAREKIYEEEIEMQHSSGKYSFKNEELERIRFGCVVSEIYQALQRINREGAHRAEFFVAVSDKEVIEELKKQLPGISVKNYGEVNFEFVKTVKPPKLKNRNILNY